MKKLIIGLCAASLLAASAIGYAGTVTFVNKYDQPVTFVVSQGAIYNPIGGGTLMPGQTSSQYIPGYFDSNTHFMAYPPNSSSIVSNCGTPMVSMDAVTVKAGWSKWDGMFGCRIYDTQNYQQYVKTYHHECPKYNQ